MSAILAGPVGVIAGIATNQWIVAIGAAFLPLLGARLVGWVEVHEDEVRHRRLMGESTIVRFSDVREVGLGMHQVRRTRWWYPEVELTTGESVKFLMLKSLSGHRTIERIEEIYTAAKDAMPDAPEDQFTSVTTSTDGEMEFLLSPGYDSFRRERAEAGDAFEVSSPSTPERGLDLAPSPETVQTASVEPHLTLVAGIDALDDPVDNAPEVFVPGPLVPYKAAASVPLSVVPELTESGATDVGVLHQSILDRLVPPPIPQMIPVVIEPPASGRRRSERGTDRRGPDRAFTSLFTREIDSQKSASAA